MKLSEVKLGALQEAFDQEMHRIIDNIRDEDTGLKDKRSITISVEIKPFEDREHCSVTYKVSRKEAPKMIFGSTLIRRNDDTHLLELSEAGADQLAGQSNIMQFDKAAKK